MIITIKNLQQQTFTVQCEPENTVLELKEFIFKDRGTEYVVEKQKLIYAGVILEDERTVATYNIDEKKFVVVMLKRDLGGPISQKPSDIASGRTNTINDPKKTSTSKIDAKNSDGKNSSTTTTTITDSTAPTSATMTTASGIDNSSTASSEILSIAADSNASIGTTTNRSTFSSGDLVGALAFNSFQSQAASNLLMGEEYNQSVESMIEMGYCRDMVERAMAASFNNPERAVEYLISGIPETDDGFNATPQSVPTSEATAAISPNQEELNTIGQEDPFEFLRNQPQFLQMRSLVCQNPDLLQAVLQQIGQTNPALLQLISENQDAFLNMLNQPLDSERNVQHSRHSTPAHTIRLPTGTPTTTGGEGLHIPLLDTAHRSAGDSTLSAAREQTVSGVSDSDHLLAPNPVPVPPSGDGIAVDRNRLSSGVSSNIDGGNNEVTTIRLTQQDQEAVERLKALGFPEALVLQAYFACEKDEQLAANFLITSAFDD